LEKINKIGLAEWVKCLPSNCEALQNSNSSATKANKNKVRKNGDSKPALGKYFPRPYLEKHPTQDRTGRVA
jgi:hypothetical protein